MANRKIALITIHTPTPENTRGASALPYHLIANRPNSCDIRVYSYNINRVDNESITTISHNLDCQIRVLSQNFGFKFLRNRLSALLRAVLPYPVFHYLKLPTETAEEITKWADNVWIYGEELAEMVSIFPKKQNVVTTPDCEAMYYRRVLDMPSKLPSYGKIFRYGRAYWQYLNVVRSFPTENVVYHLVGEEDASFLRGINPQACAIFIPHPHYEGNDRRTIKFVTPKIRLILPGRYDFYCHEAIDCAIDAMVQHSELAKYYNITFQGRNWDIPASKLEKVGYSVELKGFVQNYKDELCKHDIQLSPISVGTGTKGKVLDAFVNGLLVIAPLRAIENIQVENKSDYLFYKTGSELIEILKAIPHDIEHYERVADRGRNAVLEKHSTQTVAKRFFELFRL